MIGEILAIGVVCFFLIYLSISLDKEHFLLKLFFIFAGVSLLILVPKTTLEDNCSLELNHTISAGTPVVETYHYATVCANQTMTGNTGTTFYTSYLWILRVFWAYVFAYLVYKILLHYGVIVFKGKK